MNHLVIIPNVRRIDGPLKMKDVMALPAPQLVLMNQCNSMLMDITRELISTDKKFPDTKNSQNVRILYTVLDV